MTLPALPFERLEWIDDPTPRAAVLNMALDETLLSGLGHDPLLRVYRWARRSVSIGYFDRAESVIRRWPDHDLVRRWTGGGIVEHGDDLTFSLLVPGSLILATLPVEASYRVIHGALAMALANNGGPATVFGSAAIAPASGGSHACFERPVKDDLLLAGRKVAGGAQRRTRHGLLHQGSVQNIAEANGFTALARALPGAFARSVHQRDIRLAELTAAASLVKSKYGTEDWQRRF